MAPTHLALIPRRQVLTAAQPHPSTDDDHDGSRFTPRASKSLELALREAIHLRHRHIGTEHLLLGLLREGGGTAAAILTGAGLDPRTLRAATLTELDGAA